MTDYVCGLVFQKSISGLKILLTRKTNPSWQKGLWNGCGGKIEENESPLEAMVREGQEEMYLTHDVTDSLWRAFATERGPDYMVYFFKIWASDSYVIPEMNDVGEEIGAWVVGNLRLPDIMVGNLQWIIPLALDWRDIRVDVRTEASIARRPTW